MRKAARAIILSQDSLLVMHRNKFGQEYEILVGGGVEIGETPEQALMREIQEETGVSVSLPRLVFLEQAAEPYGYQYVFLCQYLSGDPVIDPSTLEYKISQAGKNTYQPKWIKFNDLETAKFRSEPLRKSIIHGLKNGFPPQPIDITNV